MIGPGVTPRREGVSTEGGEDIASGLGSTATDGEVLHRTVAELIPGEEAVEALVGIVDGGTRLILDRALVARDEDLPLRSRA